MVIGAVGNLQCQQTVCVGEAIDAAAAVVAVHCAHAAGIGVEGHDAVGEIVQQLIAVSPQSAVVALPVAAVTSVGEPCGVNGEYGLGIISAVPTTDFPFGDEIELFFAGNKAGTGGLPVFF